MSSQAKSVPDSRHKTKEEKLLIPYNLALSVQSGGRSVPLDKCTPASASTVYNTEELKVP